MASDNLNSVIEVKNLTKNFNGFKAVDNLSLSVKKGEIFGFLGPNGAGKTTTIKSILGLISHDKGTIKINGKNLSEDGIKIKKNIGYLPELVSFYNNLTALQNMEFYAELKNSDKSQCPKLLQDIGLGDSGNKKVGEFSKGMKQRLGMARAMIGSPSLMILDEPASGLDPRGVKLVRDIIKKLNDQGVTLFISSHILSEIQAVCTQVGIIKKGVLVAHDSMESLSEKSQVKPKVFVEVKEIDESIKKAVMKIKGTSNVIIRGKIIEVSCDPDLRSKIITEITNSGGEIVNFWTKEASLEDVFMKYTEGE